MISKKELNRRTRLYTQIANKYPETNTQFVLTCIKLAMYWYPNAPEEGQKYWAEVYLKRYTPEEAKELLEDDLKINNPYSNKKGINPMPTNVTDVWPPSSVIVDENMSIIPCPWPPLKETVSYTPPIITEPKAGQQASPTLAPCQKTTDNELINEIIIKIKKETHTSLTSLVETRIQILKEKAEISKLSSTSIDFSKYLTAKNEMEKLYDLFQDWIKTIG